MDPRLSEWLARFLEAHGAVAGTVHALDGELLRLRAAINIPEPVQQLTREIPKGKGMAGLAWERSAPVSTCNLQSDASGDVRPGAKAVHAQAAAALPVEGDDGALAFVVGVAFREDRELAEEEVAALGRAAQKVRSVQ